MGGRDEWVAGRGERMGGAGENISSIHTLYWEKKCPLL